MSLELYGTPGCPWTAELRDQLELDGDDFVEYNVEADPAAFERHYHDIHVPLAKQLPGLRRYEISRPPIMNVLPGETPYRVATLYFDNLEAIRTAFASDIGRACAVDRRKLAGDDDMVAMLLFDTEPL